MKTSALILCLSLTAFSAFAQTETAPLTAEQKTRVMGFLGRMQTAGQQLASAMTQAGDACVTSGDSSYTEIVSSAACPLDLDVEQSVSESTIEGTDIKLPSGKGRFKMAVALAGSDLMSADGDYSFLTEARVKLDPKPQVVIDFATTTDGVIQSRSEGEVEALIYWNLSLAMGVKRELRSSELRVRLIFSDFEASLELFVDAEQSVTGTVNGEAVDSEWLNSIQAQIRQLTQTLTQNKTELPQN